MATVKYSRQREAIKNFLMSRKDHPTAEVVYEHVLKAFPNISLGTVYRNLSFLVDNGQAVKVPCEDGSVHFDGNVMPHYHFQCTECGAVIDLDFDGAESHICPLKTFLFLTSYHLPFLLRFYNHYSNIIFSAVCIGCCDQIFRSGFNIRGRLYNL